MGKAANSSICERGQDQPMLQFLDPQAKGGFRALLC